MTSKKGKKWLMTLTSAYRLMADNFPPMAGDGTFFIVTPNRNSRRMAATTSLTPNCKWKDKAYRQSQGAGRNPPTAICMLLSSCHEKTEKSHRAVLCRGSVRRLPPLRVPYKVKSQGLSWGTERCSLSARFVSHRKSGEKDRITEKR